MAASPGTAQYAVPSSLHSAAQPAAQASASALASASGAARLRPRPRVFVYPLGVAWRVGPQLLVELDREITERLLASPHREADPYATQASNPGLADPRQVSSYCSRV